MNLRNRLEALERRHGGRINPELLAEKMNAALRELDLATVGDLDGFEPITVEQVKAWPKLPTHRGSYARHY